MIQDNSLGRRIFVIVNYTVLIFLAFLALFPMLHVLAISFSSSYAAAAGLVSIYPVDLTFTSYQYVLSRVEFVRSLNISLQRLALGTVVNIVLTILAAYPLSKEVEKFRWRTVYAWFFVFTILFSGGLIPLYITVRYTGLLNSIWALVLPSAVPVFNVVLLLNFFRGLPKELEEAALLDGAGHWTILWRIFVPLSTPAIATILLFAMVGHWNSWFDGLIFMNTPARYPLQTYLHTIVIGQDFTSFSEADLQRLQEISDRTIKAAQIFLGALPIVIVYPFLQRFFMQGIVLGSVKG